MGSRSDVESSASNSVRIDHNRVKSGEEEEAGEGRGCQWVTGDTFRACQMLRAE